MSFQVSILKILAGQPEGRASLALLKDYLAVFYTSGPEWTARMKQLAERAPDLNIFGQGLVAREPGQWIITEKGQAFLALLEQRGPRLLGSERSKAGLRNLSQVSFPRMPRADKTNAPVAGIADVSA
ncbi:hypothetical protein [Bradyrhizobium sp. CCBAU 51745]|uniref:hypothetical protein n=1 Tax=Bradyrhizobium sp. CCBAU 51745 TaxID=1325099 RepID=UPI0023065CE4|nr:hypothetical protein [Bradyrhizobium sp. CCBAU 51745]